MSKNKNFTLNIPGVDKEISLDLKDFADHIRCSDGNKPFDKVEEWMMVMNHMDKSGISEEETRRIVIEEFLRFQKQKEDERMIKHKIHQAGDAIPEKASTTFIETTNPDVIVNKTSAAIPLSPTDFMNNSSKFVAQDLEVKKICQNSRYPIFVSSDDIVTIYPSNLVEKFLKSQMNKKSNREDSSFGLIALCVVGIGMGLMYYLKTKGYYPTTTSAFS